MHWSKNNYYWGGRGLQTPSDTCGQQSGNVDRLGVFLASLPAQVKFRWPKQNPAVLSYFQEAPPLLCQVQEHGQCPRDIPGSCTRGRGSGSARGTGRRSGCGHSADCLRTCREEGVGSGLSGCQLQGPQPLWLRRVCVCAPEDCFWGVGALGRDLEGQR